MRWHVPERNNVDVKYFIRSNIKHYCLKVSTAQNFKLQYVGNKFFSGSFSKKFYVFR